MESEDQIVSSSQEIQPTRSYCHFFTFSFGPLISLPNPHGFLRLFQLAMKREMTILNWVEILLCLLPSTPSFWMYLSVTFVCLGKIIHNERSLWLRVSVFSNRIWGLVCQGNKWFLGKKNPWSFQTVFQEVNFYALRSALNFICFRLSS